MKQMKTSILIAVISILILFFVEDSSAKIHRVPQDFPTIEAAVNHAGQNDTILLSPGVYKESVTTDKLLFFASNYIYSKSEADISATVVDGQAGDAVFTFTGEHERSSTLYGLTIQNGSDGIMASTPVDLFFNIVQGCKDGIDYETGGGGIIKFNTFKNNLDDAIDLDGTLFNVIIEENVISDNKDDGIEIRLHNYSGPPSYCRIKDNQIYNNGEDGIQFIDYPDSTSRYYLVERNLIYNNAKAGIAYMDNGDTKEDYRGAVI